jgi:hypothetical protein
MKALVVLGLWALSGSYVGGLVERVTGLGVTLPLLAAFVVAGIYLAVRISLAARPVDGSAGTSPASTPVSASSALSTSS